MRLAVNTMLEPVCESVPTRDRAVTRGLGGFSLYERAPWLERNQRNDPVVSPEGQLAPHFKSWKEFMDPVNEDQEDMVIGSRGERSDEPIPESRKGFLFFVKVMLGKGVEQFFSKSAEIVNKGCNIFLVIVEPFKLFGDYVLGLVTDVNVRKNIK
ncbi:hypothetical protein [Pseudomonas sp. 13B_3.2_Bac1]|uniref:hypothetical protein n=1 Tax=Pseudomonas sp. 13B_3.2_Bac1 TaxID=2971623 RepID=UPI0021C5C248|nr:hypothetical protein [Pseudomonas sp. 13B_3.2_Bac1]MCU1772392.1 hypothetical protein [Pseudomonas sp. 13B_3.2_Bac1]